MDTLCLVLTDHLANDDAATRARLAAAFEMDDATFLAKVWLRAPLIIRRGLDAETARQQLARLAALGATGEVLPDETLLLWLRRNERTLGPLPGSSLDRFARSGDRWCHEGSGDWQPYRAENTTLPPPLPEATRSAPPPLPPSTRRPRRRRAIAWMAAIAALVLLVVLWPHRSHPAPSATVNYVPRPLQPMHAQTDATIGCPGDAAPPGSDEDRFLVTGGERTLTGRAQRNGGTYVAEAISHPDTDCSNATVQLYLFRDGGFVGAATPENLPVRNVGFASFELPDPEHLRYAISPVDAGQSRCARSHSTSRFATSVLVKQSQGWMVRMDPSADVSYQARETVHYPLDTHGHRNAGKVLVHVDVDKDGFPTNVRITQGSSHPELDKAAVDSVRHGCFDPAQSSVEVPVNFSLSTL